VGHQHFALLELEPKTGRTHQIRVHCAHRGWPIVGDDMYGGSFFELPDGITIDRQMLHAALLAIEHSIAGEPIVLTAPPRENMLGLLAHLREHTTTAASPDGCVPPGRLGLGANVHNTINHPVHFLLVSSTMPRRRSDLLPLHPIQCHGAQHGL